MEIWGGFEMGRGAFSFVEVALIFAVLFKWHADNVPFLRGWGDRKDDDCSAVIPPLRHKNHSSFGLRLEGSVSREFVPVCSSQDRSMRVSYYIREIER